MQAPSPAWSGGARRSKPAGERNEADSEGILYYSSLKGFLYHSSPRESDVSGDAMGLDDLLARAAASAMASRGGLGSDSGWPEVIHPNSYFANIWDAITIAMLAYDMIFVPLQAECGSSIAIGLSASLRPTGNIESASARISRSRYEKWRHAPVRVLKHRGQCFVTAPLTHASNPLIFRAGGWVLQRRAYALPNDAAT